MPTIARSPAELVGISVTWVGRTGAPAPAAMAAATKRRTTVTW